MHKKWPNLLCLIFSLLSLPLVGSMLKKPPSRPTESSYKELVCTDQDRENIREIISAMGEKGKLALLFQQTYLRELGTHINHVHPLKFLSVIMTDQYLKSCMTIIWNDYFKKKGLLDGLVPALSREAEKGKLQLYLPDFANEVGVLHEDLKPYTDVYDWENMVLFIFQS